MQNKLDISETEIIFLIASSYYYKLNLHNSRYQSHFVCASVSVSLILSLSLSHFVWMHFERIPNIHS